MNFQFPIFKYFQRTFVTFHPAPHILANLKSTPEAKYESIEHDQAMRIHPTLATQNSASNWNASECRRLR
jgi:hypothetical protein